MFLIPQTRESPDIDGSNFENDLLASPSPTSSVICFIFSPSSFLSLLLFLFPPTPFSSTPLQLLPVSSITRFHRHFISLSRLLLLFPPPPHHHHHHHPHRVPLCYLMLEGRKDPSKVGLMYLCTFTILKLSGERSFGVALNQPYQLTLPVDVPPFSGARYGALRVPFVLCEMLRRIEYLCLFLSSCDSMFIEFHCIVFHRNELN